MDRRPNVEAVPTGVLSPAGHRFLLLASAWPEVRSGAVVGVYQALGREKVAYAAPMFESVLARGFDALRPAAIIFRFSPYGAATSVAVALGCQGPFFTLEADELAGPVAAQQAMTDLGRGRCDLALVCSASGDRAHVVLLGRSEHALRWRARFVRGSDAPPVAALDDLSASLGCRLDVCAANPDDDPHAMAALQRALRQAAAGQPSVVWCATPDRRGMLLAFAREEGH